MLVTILAHHYRWSLSLAATALSLHAGSAPDPRADTIAVSHVTVIPMTSDTTLPDQTVIVANRKIVRVGPADSIAVPAGAVRIDGRGRYLMPGLHDLHVHLFSADELIAYMANGVTTILNMDGFPAVLKWRGLVRTGQLPGPTLYSAGHIIDGAPPLNEMFLTAELPAQGAALVDETSRDGYDAVKVYGTLRPDVYRAIMAESRRMHLPVVGHVNRQIGALGVIRGGQVLAAHLEDLLFAQFDHLPNERELDEFATAIAASHISVTPNLNVNPSSMAQVRNLDSVLRSADARLISSAAYSQWMKSNNRNAGAEDPAAQIRQMQEVQDVLVRLVRKLRDDRVRLVLGTDASPYGFPGISVHDELQELVSAGFSPYQALRTATIDAGAFLTDIIGPRSRTGVIAAGYDADMLLLNANPLKDVTHTAQIAGVMTRGDWWPDTRLQERLSRSSSAAEARKRILVQVDSALEAGDVPRARVAASPLAADSTAWIAEWVLLNKARKLAQSTPHAALDVARWATELYPQSFAPWFVLADLLFSQGQREPAMLAARQASRLEPYDARTVALLTELRESAKPLTYRPAAVYEVKYGSDGGGTGQILRLVVRVAGHELAATAKGEDGQPLVVRSVVAGGSKLWILVDSPSGPLEFRIDVIGRRLAGYWDGPFGRNGAIAGTYRP